MYRVTVGALVLLALLSMGWGRSAQANEHLTVDIIKIALHTSEQEEQGFIEKVVAAVDKGTLPEDLLQSTFLWARKKQKNKFQYFKRALILRAAELKIIIDDNGNVTKK
jgi:hypothetical protein